MMTIKELEAKVAALKEENNQKFQEKVTIARLKAQIELEGNETLLDAKAQQALRNEQTEKLREIVQVCAAIPSEFPIAKKRSSDVRTWMGKNRYGFNSQVDLMYQLVSGILYSCQEHKDMMFTHTGLNAELVEQTVAAFGIPSYYNYNTNMIVEETPYNVDAVHSMLGILQSELGVVIDTSQITEKKFADQFEAARKAAVDNYEAAQKAIAEADFVL
jgi:hypothetical protein